MLSIICASNNKQILEECLKQSLSKQTYKDFELIVVDTKKNKYAGATEALMLGAQKAKGDILIFVHHDVIFNTEYELQKIVNQIEKIKDFGILGIAGAPYKKGTLVGNITNGEPKIRISDIMIENETDVQTLDEVMFIIRRDVLKKYPLNEKNETWHLYAVEYCLLMKENKQQVLVIPCDIHHLSAGASMNDEYYKQLRKICAEYKRHYKTINTTCGYWFTNKILLELQIYRHLRRINKK